MRFDVVAADVRKSVLLCRPVIPELQSLRQVGYASVVLYYLLVTLIALGSLLNEVWIRCALASTLLRPSACWPMRVPLRVEPLEPFMLSKLHVPIRVVLLSLQQDSLTPAELRLLSHACLQLPLPDDVVYNGYYYMDFSGSTFQV